MTTSVVVTGRRAKPSGRTVGLLAVVAVVVCFSLGSTLVKRAHTPGVLVAFWRMVTTTIVWNAILLTRGRHLRVADIKQALIPGIFFGLNITCFYAGATHNSVANAELIGSLTPFLVVPIGARFFKEYINVRALLFALVAFVGVAIVLFTAPPRGDASLKGNVLGFSAMLLWATYIATTRHFRREMDVITFMASITPIAIVTVLPLALLNGNMLDISRTGWSYIALLTFVTGVAAHGLMVFAQKTIPIGTIGIAQVAQPALAALWSFLIVGETLRGSQFFGMALVLGGLLSFVIMNQRKPIQATTDQPEDAPAS